MDRQAKTQLLPRLAYTHFILRSVLFVLAVLGFQLFDASLHLMQLNHENRGRIGLLLKI